MTSSSNAPQPGPDVVDRLLSGGVVNTNDLAEYLILKLCCPELELVDAVSEPVSEAVKTEQPGLAFTSHRIRLTFRLDPVPFRDRIKDTGQSPKENLKWHLRNAQATAALPLSLSIGHAIHSREFDFMAKELKAIEKFLNRNLFRK